MKVLHIFNEIKHSGAEIMYAKAASFFQKNGIELHAISTGNSIGDFNQTFIDKGIKTYHLPFPGKRFSVIKRLLYFFNFYKFIKLHQIDVLHIHRNDIFTLGLVAKVAGVPTLKTMHSVFKNRWLTRPYAILKRWKARNFYRITFQSIGESVYSNELSYYKNPSVKINNWYDATSFYPAINQNEKQEIKQQLGLSLDSFVIISVGGCSHIKNHHDIIKAIALLPNTLNVQYIHLGTGVTENEEKQLAKSLGVYDKIYFWGNKNNVRDYIIAADVFVMSSKHEGLGNAALEAMASGLPSVLYNSPGLKDLINNDDNGFLIEPSYELIAQKILEYKNHPGLKYEKAKSAMIFVNQNFSLKKNVQKIINLYHSMLQ